MTGKSKTSPSEPATAALPGEPWPLQDAKARLREAAPRARGEGQRCVTARGRDEVVVAAIDELCRLNGDASGEILVAALRASPGPDIDMAPRRTRSPVRKVDL